MGLRTEMFDRPQNMEGKIRFQTLMPNGVDAVTAEAEDETGLVKDALYCPLDWYSVPHIYNGLRRGHTVMVGSVQDLPPRPDTLEDTVDWMTGNADKFRLVSSGIADSIQLSMLAASIMNTPGTATDFLRTAAMPTSPLVLGARGLSPMFIRAIEFLGLAAGPAAMIAALLVHPASYISSGEPHSPELLMERLVQDEYPLGHWGHLSMLEADATDVSDVGALLGSTSEVLTALAFMAWCPSGRFHEVTPKNTYWRTYAQQLAEKYSDDIEETKKLVETEPAEVKTVADRVIRDVTLHVLKYIFTQMLHNTTTEYDFDPDTFFTEDDAIAKWMKSQETL